MMDHLSKTRTRVEAFEILVNRSLAQFVERERNLAEARQYWAQFDVLTDDAGKPPANWKALVEKYWRGRVNVYVYCFEKTFDDALAIIRTKEPDLFALMEEIERAKG